MRRRRARNAPIARGDGRALVVLAAPIALTQLAQVALNTVAIVMIAPLGTEKLAAGGLAFLLFSQLHTMGVGLVTAAGNWIAVEVVRGETEVGVDTHDQVRGVLRASLLVATVAGLMGALIMIACGQALKSLGQQPAVVDAVRPMLLALAPGLLPCLWFQALRQYTIGMRIPRALVWIMVTAIGANVLLNSALGYGAWIFPRLELVGIALACSLAHLLTCVLLYNAVRLDAALAPALSIRAWRASRATLRRLVALGTPIALTYGSEAAFFSVVALIMGGFGAVALAAHTVVNQLVYIAFQITTGLSHSASILVSRQVALERTAAALRTSRTALIVGSAVMAVMGIIYIVTPDLVLAPFLSDADTTDRAAHALATNLLIIAAILQFADCAQNIGVGLLRGLDDTKAGLRATFLGCWIVGLPLALGVGHGLDGGPEGVWVGLLAGLGATAALLLTRFGRELHSRGAGHRLAAEAARAAQAAAP
jgi:MATE family multidrug resistance protein